MLLDLLARLAQVVKRDSVVHVVKGEHLVAPVRLVVLDPQDLPEREVLLVLMDLLYVPSSLISVQFNKILCFV